MQRADGEADGTVPVGESRLLHARLREHGGAPDLTLLPGVGHDSWNAAYAGDELASWMLSHDPGPHPGHALVTQGNGKLVRYGRDGSVEWELPWGAIHDIHVLESGNLMVQRGHAAVVEIDVATKAVVWEYDAESSNGNTPGSVEVHAFQPLASGNVMIAESGTARIIEVDRAGKLVHSLPLKVNRPHRHMDTRLARKLPGGTYLVCHEGDGFVREYDSSGAVVWEYDVPMFGREHHGGHGPESFGDKTFGALRLPNGNTLIATGNGHSVLEVTPWKDIVWSVTQDELPGIRLAWVTTLEVLESGNYLIGNCHAGPGQPLLIELEPESKRVVWTFDAHDALGNNVSNSALIGERTLR